MFRLRVTAALLAIGLVLGGCAQLQVIRGTLEAAKEIVVSRKAVFLAVNTSRATERLATVYLDQKKCPRGIQRPTCRSPEITETIATAIGEMRKARDTLLDFVEEHPCPETGPCAIGSQGLYDGMKAATGTLRSILTTYKIGV